MPIRSEEIKLQVDGGRIAAYLAVPESGHGSGILLLHAWWGLKPFFKGVCDRLAEQGFVVLAPDLNAGKIATSIAAAEKLMARRNFETTRGIVVAAKDALLAHPARTGAKIGLIGFSMGAAWSLVLSTIAPDQVGELVLYYGSNPVDFTEVKARILGHFARADRWEPLEGIREMEKEMKAAGLDVKFHIYPDVSHWFVEEDRREYDEQAAELAWKRTVTFLRESI